MKKIFVLFLLITSTVFAADRHTDVTKAVAKAMPNVTTLIVDGKMRGAGVSVSDKYVATASHVCHGKTIVTVTYKEVNYNGKVVFDDDSFDLALVEMPIKMNYSKLCVEPILGEVAIAIGHPHSFYFSVSTGIVSGFDRTSTLAKELLQHSAVINPGSSGGPLFNINGDLLGINVITWNNGVGLAVKAANIKRALDLMR